MGGGAAMRVAGKFAGVVYGSFRGAFPAFPKNITSAAFKVNITRPVTGVISETQYGVASSMVNKPLIEFEDREVASSCDVGQPLPRLVFGGAPTLEEAKDATFQLSTALDQVYLSNESSEGSYESDTGHSKLAMSDSGHLESKACVTKASAPNQAVQAFRLLKESAAIQTVVASIASDQNVWDAAMQNVELLEFIQSQNAGMNDSFEESTAGTESPGYQSPKHTDDETFDEKEPKNGFNSYLKDIKSRVEDMMNSLSGFFQNHFAGPAAYGGSPEVDSGFFQNHFAGPAAYGGSPGGSPEVHKTMVASKIMGLVVMVIMVVVFKRV